MRATSAPVRASAQRGCFVVGLASAAATGALDRDAEASGELFGQGLAMFSMFSAAIAFFVQRRRIAKP
jgi:F0F1-type ATP synthase membrane subunit c/vacuolar-type H+-ATPase subunit K